MKKTTLFIATLLAAIVPAVAAEAACSQADARGRWLVSSMNSDDDVVRCSISVNAYGTIARTTCTAFYGSSSTWSVPLNGGRITLADPTRCSFRGNIIFGDTVNTVRELSISPDKSVGQGIGTYPGGTFFMGMTRF